MSDYLMHRGSGWTKKNHKYVSRYKKNGKWFYVYKNGKKYNKLQDWLGFDERDAFNKADNDYTDATKSVWNLWEKVNPNKAKTRVIPVGYAQYAINKAETWNKRVDALKAYEKTPLYKVTKATNKTKSFIKGLFKKKIPEPQVYRSGGKDHYSFGGLGTHHGKR